MNSGHDLIVLGAGSGGLAVAQRAAQHGAKVALVDPGEVGGTCVHRGCVPKKALWFAAQLAQQQQLALEMGFASQPGALDWERFRRLRQDYIDAIDQRYTARLQHAGIEWLRHAGHFVAADTIALRDGSHLRAPHVVIATGARPRRLKVPGAELGMVSDDVFAAVALPRRLAIVGGGYIAVEFAGLLRALGSEVDMLAGDRLLEPFDADMVQALGVHMQEQGIRIHRGGGIRAAHCRDGRFFLDDTDGRTHGPFDDLLWAVGRVPRSDALGLETVGVATDEHGHVQTDEWQDTNVSGIHAIGDVTSRKALTPVAVAAGRRLADRLFGGQPEARLDYADIPTMVFGEPPLGMVGLTEAQAREEHGEAVVVYQHRFTPMQWALAGRRQQSVMKLLCVGEEERVVGIHALGPGVDEMLQGFAVALKLGLRKRDLEAAVAVHPTSSEELVQTG